MVSVLTDKGNRRNLNEDNFSYLEEENYSVYVVADGMGGHNAGEVASKMAAEGIVKYIKENVNDFDIKSILSKSIEKVNNDIYEYSLQDHKYSGMGTTITAALVTKEEIIIANVGDSSSFGVKGDKLIKITKDHSLVQELVDLGTITEEQAAKHPKKNIITRAVGINSKVNVDIFYIEKSEYDIFLLCSDGLTNEVPKEDIIKILSLDCNLDKKCEQLVELAKKNGGRDNITVLLFGGEK